MRPYRLLDDALLYERPSTRSRVLRRCRKGDRVSVGELVDGDGRRWARATDDSGAEGFVPADTRMAFAGEAPPPPPPPAAPPAPPPPAPPERVPAAAGPPAAFRLPAPRVVDKAMVALDASYRGVVVVKHADVEAYLAFGDNRLGLTFRQATQVFAATIGLAVLPSAPEPGTPPFNARVKAMMAKDPEAKWYASARELLDGPPPPEWDVPVYAVFFA